MKNIIAVILAAAFVLPGAGVYAGDSTSREWVEAMRDSPRGPFSRIRWFCNDGSILPPKSYACAEHGGGIQHGQWSDKTQTLRQNGYFIANLLAGVDPAAYLSAVDVEQRYAQLLIEKFLIAVDEGWIFHQALFYRGAIQEEDERAGARALLLQMLADPEWLGPRFVALRAGMRLLPHGEDSASIGSIRQWSASLAEDDPAFSPMRVKIHGSPDASDAASVRAFARESAREDLQQRYEELASEIDGVYASVPVKELLEQWSQRSQLTPALAQVFRQASIQWRDAPATRHAVSGSLMASIRSNLDSVVSPSQRLTLLDLSLRIETEHFRAATELAGGLALLSRREILSSASASANAAYGTGLLNKRLHEQLQTELSGLTDVVDLETYRSTLSYLGRAPGWGVQAMRRYFYQSMMQLYEIEPKSILFIQDQLRGSPLLYLSHALDILLRDAGILAGVKHRVFGQDVGVGLNPLNPGLARGTLYLEMPEGEPDQLASNGIYLLPETVSDLPPVAGILTLGSGNPLSHVQLLARNLGIPNVSISADLVESLKQYDGQPVVLAVSRGGAVQLQQDGPHWDKVLGGSNLAKDVVIAPDLKKLDLRPRTMLSLETLSADDSGRTVGPKAAKLGELKKHYPDAVSRGIAIPFGLFKSVALDQPHPSGVTLFEWMQTSYAELAAMEEGERKQRKTETFRRELYAAILAVQLPVSFKDELRSSLAREFGDEEVGLFVRSDTNVEDLAGFTGAGLNLTLPNVVGFDALLAAIPRVWASPFTARAFAWRQSHMKDPEHVYTSILLLESVGSDKSGVLVTADIDSGNRDIISVAVNEGLGGAVDGQAAESLRIRLTDGDVSVLATATAPWRRVPDPTGGILKLPASGSDAVLYPQELVRLIDFAKHLPDRFPPITDDAGGTAPADVEFGFLDGQLRLFQLRPFLDSSAANGSVYLQSMDAARSSTELVSVSMQERPATLVP
ncbi:MAG: PEP/pyruvate-binding domain-containing protein [Halioglobus sp.]